MELREKHSLRIIVSKNAEASARGRKRNAKGAPAY